MLETFILSYKIKSTYTINSIIFSLLNFPLFGKLIFTKIKNSKIIKVIAKIILFIKELSMIFAGKFIYITLLIFMLSGMNSNNFLNIYLFLTLSGLIINTFLFNPTKDKYYAIINLRMNTKDYVISNYIYEMLKIIIGTIPFTIIYGLLLGIKFDIITMIPFFIIGIKTTFNYIKLYIDYNNDNIRSENNMNYRQGILVLLLIGLAYGLPLINYSITQEMFLIISIISLFSGIYCFIKLYNFKHYKEVYKKLLQSNNIIFNVQKYSENIQKQNLSSKVSYSEIETNEKGMKYFNYVFIERHKKILKNTTSKISLIAFIIFFILIVLTLFYKEIAINLNVGPLQSLPYFLLVMYFINRGEIITRAMFMNCDHSMLNYNFYKSPKIILELFKERLKTLIKINLGPAIIIGSGLCILLFFTGGTNNPLNYVIIFLTLLSMSILFSVHYLILYYLFQPYNIQSELVDSKYRTISIATYLIVYFTFDLNIPSILYGTIVIIFTFIYVIISLILVYYRAPKTFRIK